MIRVRVATVLAGITLVGAACSSSGSPQSSTTTAASGASTPTTTTATPAATLLAVGDISTCTNDNDSKTAALAATRPGPIALLGDIAYEKGSTSEFEQCYAPAWSALDDRARPVPGNHEYNTKNATGYYAYFGDKAGNPTQGWYSYRVGAWHVIALNSNCDAIGGCGAESPQARWLRQDLADNAARCTLAYWHHPRWSSGIHGPTEAMDPIWRILAAAGADVVLSGHDHDYERFAPKDADGRSDSNGVRQFVVGTGGRSLYPTLLQRSGSEAINSDTYGILELKLGASAYSWRFEPVVGATFTDEGTTNCSG